MLQKRPMARVRQVRLFRRRVTETVDPTGLQACLAAAQHISEGQIGTGGRFFGGTYVTVDLARLRPALREACNGVTARRLAVMLRRRPRLLEGWRSLCLSEGEALAGVALDEPNIEIKVRTEGCKVLVDLDLEARVAVAARDENG